MNNKGQLYSQVAERIISEQEAIIGPVALEQARKVRGLKLSDHHVQIQGNQSAVIDELIQQYQKLFGQTSVEVCREAAGSLIAKLTPQEVPSLLR